jgi:hypothetical protein
MEKEEELAKNFQIAIRDEQRRERKLRSSYKLQLKGLINVTGLFRYLNSDMSYWLPEGIVEIVLTDEKSSGYSTYQHARINGKKDKYLYMRVECDEVKGIDHYYVWQTTGCCEDDYSGYLLFPLKDGKYFKIWYSM